MPALLLLGRFHAVLLANVQHLAMPVQFLVTPEIRSTTKADSSIGLASKARPVRLASSEPATANAGN